MTTVSSGQTASALTIDPGQTLSVLSGGTAIDIAIDYGGQELLLGGTDSSSNIDGLQAVSSGGHADGTTVGFYGLQAVYSGGTASGATVEGNEVVYAGGVTSDTTVIRGISISAPGTETVSGGLAVDTTVTAAGELVVMGSGTVKGSATGAILQGGSQFQIYNGGVVISATLDSPFTGVGTTFVIGDVSSGGAAVSTTVSSGAILEILAGATGTGTVILSGGAEGVTGTSYNDTLMAGGTLQAEGISIFTENAGTVDVLSGTIVGLGDVVQSGPGTLKLAGASTLFLGTDIITGGTLELANVNTIDRGTIRFQGDTGTLRIDGPAALGNTISGMISGTAIDIAGMPYVSSGTVSVSGDSVTITEGARHQTLTIAGASADGPFSLAAAADGSTLLTNSAIAPLVSAGENYVVSSGQISHDAQIFAGGTLTVLSGGGAVATLDFGEEILAGGTATAGTVSSGGVLIVSAGGVADGATVLNSGSQIVSSGGSAINAMVNSGGAQTILAGGTATGGTFASFSATQTVMSGGTVSFTRMSGTQLLLGGTDLSGRMIEGGEQIVGAGGTANFTTFSAFATEEVDSGGLASGVVIGNQASQVILSGGRAIDETIYGITTLYAGAVTSEGLFQGTVFISGGTAIDTTVGAYGSLTVDGALSSGTVVSIGSAAGTTVSGELVVDTGGVVTDTVINGGIEIVAGGGSAFGTTILPGSQGIDFGGSQTIDFGGTASGTVLVSGDVQAISATGIAIDDTVGFGARIVNSGTLVFTEAAGATNRMAGTISGGGTLVQSGPGTFTLAGTVSKFGGSVVISGGTLELTSAGAAGAGAIVFAGGGTLQVNGTGVPVNTISGFDVGDAIDLTGLVYTTSGDVTVSGNHVTITEGSASATLTVAGASSFNFLLTPDSGTGTELRVACYCPGTAIRTPSGDRPVEDLAVGDSVVTFDGGPESVKWIGHRSYAGRFVAGNHLMLPVTIKRDALAKGVPHADLTVSPGHAIWVDGQLVPVWRLVNDVSITQAAAVTEVTYLHIELERHALLLANGMPAESFVDDQGFRGQFQNAGEFHARYPDAAPVMPLQPRLEDGFALSAIRERLNARAGILPSVEPAGPLRGYLDQAGPHRVCGWAQDIDSPDEPVTLELAVGGVPVLCVLANAYRADLRKAGIGSGCHAFDTALPDGLAGPVTVRRVTDGAVLCPTAAADQVWCRAG